MIDPLHILTCYVCGERQLPDNPRRTLGDACTCGRAPCWGRHTFPQPQPRCPQWLEEGYTGCPICGHSAYGECCCG